MVRNQIVFFSLCGAIIILCTAWGLIGYMKERRAQHELVIVCDDEREFTRSARWRLRGSEVVYLKDEDAIEEYFWHGYGKRDKHLRYYDQIWLDHDLGERGGTTRPFVHMLEMFGVFQVQFQVGHIYVHTANPEGATEIMLALRKYYDVTRVNAVHCDLLPVDGGAESS